MLDVAIVGGGPAGAWTACRLASAGARVALFDGSHPREKPCGGGVTGRALELLSAACGSSLAYLDTVRVRGARFTTASVPLASDALVVASRRAFDAALLETAQTAGATLVRERVNNVEVDPHGVVVRTATGTHRAAWIVGADGANSLVRRRVARPFPRRALSLATGFYVHGLTSDEIVVDFIADPPGYIWSFPRPDHLAIGVCAQADAGATSAALRSRVEAWIHTAAGHPLPTDAADTRRWEPYAWPIPSLTRRDFDEPVADARWLLVGDAAGFVDPITREGIFFALESGGHAASALQSASAAVAYNALVRRDIVSELLLAARIKSAFFTPAFVQLLMTALERSERIRSVMADLVAGRQPYRTLKRRLLKTLELRLAWSALSVRLKPHTTETSTQGSQ